MALPAGGSPSPALPPEVAHTAFSCAFGYRSPSKCLALLPCWRRLWPCDLPLLHERIHSFRPTGEVPSTMRAPSASNVSKTSKLLALARGRFAPSPTASRGHGAPSSPDAPNIDCSPSSNAIDAMRPISPFDPFASKPWHSLHLFASLCISLHLFASLCISLPCALVERPRCSHSARNSATVLRLEVSCPRHGQLVRRNPSRSSASPAILARRTSRMCFGRIPALSSRRFQLPLWCNGSH